MPDADCRALVCVCSIPKLLCRAGKEISQAHKGVKKRVCCTFFTDRLQSPSLRHDLRDHFRFGKGSQSNWLLKFELSRLLILFLQQLLGELLSFPVLTVFLADVRWQMGLQKKREEPHGWSFSKHAE